MRKKSYYKLIVIFLICLLAVSLFYNYQYKQHQKQEDIGHSLFMNDFYYELDDTIDTMDRLIDGDFQNLHLTLLHLSNQLTTLEYMLSRVPYYIFDRGAVPTDIEKINQIINYGESYNEHTIPPFVADDQLSNQERVFLEVAKNHLELPRDLLKSEEEITIDPDIQLEKFHDIISETIYGAYEYRSFLDQYLKAMDR